MSEPIHAAGRPTTRHSPETRQPAPPVLYGRRHAPRSSPADTRGAGDESTTASQRLETALYPEFRLEGRCASRIRAKGTPAHRFWCGPPPGRSTGGPRAILRCNWRGAIRCFPMSRCDIAVQLCGRSYALDLAARDRNDCRQKLAPCAGAVIVATRSVMRSARRGGGTAHGDRGEPGPSAGHQPTATPRRGRRSPTRAAPEGCRRSPSPHRLGHSAR